MNRVFKTVKYVVHETLKSILVFYIVISFVFIFFGLVLPMFFPNSSSNLSGMEIATTIFLFVSGLNMFKSNYLFLQANGVTRRDYFTGALMAIAAVALSMTVIGAALDGLMGLFIDMTHGLSTYIYPYSGFVDSFLWTLAINLLAVYGGWFITMLYYRSGKPLKLVVSLSPAVVLIGIPVLDSTTGIGLQNALNGFFRAIMGLSGTPNAYVGALSMLVMALIAAGLAFLLVRRAPVKEQDK